jgi:hypothetical protein
MVRLIERIPQQIAQLPDTFLRRILVYLDQAGYIIQGIKEKMRIQLALQSLILRFDRTLFQIYIPLVKHDSMPIEIIRSRQSYNHHLHQPNE